MTAVKARRLTRAQVDKILREYNLHARVRAILEPLAPYVFTNPGLPSAPWDRRIGYCPARNRETVVLTTVGPLGITVYDDWIACVFDDAEEAHLAVGATVPSGKWNHHAFVGYVHGLTSREDMEASLDRVVAGFAARLGWITDPRGTYEGPTGPGLRG